MPRRWTSFTRIFANPAMETAIALVHSRFSTNTFPSWERAHPYRYIDSQRRDQHAARQRSTGCMRAKRMFESELFGDDIKKLFPIIKTDGSDSAMFDNCLELLVLSGRSLPHAMMMMIPEPWANHESMSEEKKAFYEYHSCLMEPWDGPASIAFTDGIVIGAVLDRNGLRPSRYYVTKDDLVIMASEVGVLDMPPERVLAKGPAATGPHVPGRYRRRAASSATKRSKQEIATAHPYRPMARKNIMVDFDDCPRCRTELPEPNHQAMLHRQQAFGYTFEDLRIIIGPMAQNGVEAVGSMGTDTPLAVLSDKPQLLYNYFKQLFAQVTNPPIDRDPRRDRSPRRKLTIGSEGNLLEPEPESCRLIELQDPDSDQRRIGKASRTSISRDSNPLTLPILFKPREGESGLGKGDG